MVEQFLTEYWLFVEALLMRAADLTGVTPLNAYAAALGYPFAPAVVLSAGGCAGALALLVAGRPGWGLLVLTVGEELAALSAASAAFSQGAGFGSAVALARLAAAAVAVTLVCALLRKALRLSRGTAPAAPGIPPAS